MQPEFSPAVISAEEGSAQWSVPHKFPFFLAFFHVLLKLMPSVVLAWCTDVPCPPQAAFNEDQIVGESARAWQGQCHLAVPLPAGPSTRED